MSEIEVYTEKLRTAAGDNEAVQGGLRGIIRAAENAFAVGTAAWGDDKFGAQFAEGPDGFNARMKNLIEGAESMAESYKEQAKGQYNGAKALDNAEDAGTLGFQT
ncbi:hypothetical protein HLB23_18680 [Nocardia uniformis]|uniref:Uncharacterized protein n=1 Tax=Nocardia uniformis TaxID=53432 RepID=A0A849C618_9NOCA|nr:hypothetical protein [Nocardia uniformis]NNH71860.1 hypothetical protein [Nocardia uniformis]